MVNVFSVTVVWLRCLERRGKTHTPQSTSKERDTWMRTIAPTSRPRSTPRCDRTQACSYRICHTYVSPHLAGNTYQHSKPKQKANLFLRTQHLLIPLASGYAHAPQVYVALCCSCRPFMGTHQPSGGCTPLSPNNSRTQKPVAALRPRSAPTGAHTPTSSHPVRTSAPSSHLHSCEEQ